MSRQYRIEIGHKNDMFFVVEPVNASLEFNDNNKQIVSIHYGAKDAFAKINKLLGPKEKRNFAIEGYFDKTGRLL